MICDDKEILLNRIKTTISDIAPDATIILYGSFARGEENVESDIDILILLEKDKITWEDEKEISFLLYDIEFETGKIISPLILSKKEWKIKHRITPFYENVSKEGVVL